MEKYTIPDHMREHAEKLNLLDKLSDENIEHLMMVLFGSFAIGLIEKDLFVSPVAFMQAIGLSEDKIIEIHAMLTNEAHGLLK